MARQTKLDRLISEIYQRWNDPKLAGKFIGEKYYIFRKDERLGYSLRDPRHWTPEDMRRFKAKVRPRLIAVLHSNGRVEYH